MGDSMTLDSSAIESLKAGLRGPLFLPGDDGYETARTVWNAIDPTGGPPGRPLCGSERHQGRRSTSLAPMVY